MIDRKSEFCLVSSCIQLFLLLAILKIATETHQHMFGWSPLKARFIQFGQSALAFSINFSYVPFHLVTGHYWLPESPAIHDFYM